MELSTFAALILLATVAVITLFRHLTRRKLNLPPGPKPWHIIGNLNLLARPLPHGNMHALVQKYGPIMQLQFGSFPVVVGSSVEMAEACYVLHDHACRADVEIGYRADMGVGSGRVQTWAHHLHLYSINQERSSHVSWDAVPILQ